MKLGLVPGDQGMSVVPGEGFYLKDTRRSVLRRADPKSSPTATPIRQYCWPAEVVLQLQYRTSPIALSGYAWPPLSNRLRPKPFAQFLEVLFEARRGDQDQEFGWSWSLVPVGMDKPPGDEDVGST